MPTADVFDDLAALVPSSGRPSLLGITGAVAVGKSTAASRLCDALAPRSAAVVETDGFLLANAELERRGAMHRKGQPDTYDVDALVALVEDVRAGRPTTAPVYSHLTYDRVAGVICAVPTVDVVILEGLHLLHDRFADVRESLDLSVFLDATDSDLESWYVDRLRALVLESRDAPHAFEFYRALDPDDVTVVAREIWSSVNMPNNTEFVVPTRDRADIVLEQGPGHAVVSLRDRGSRGKAP